MASGGEYKSHWKEYVFVFVWLTVLTALEIAIPEIDSISKMNKAISLCVLAVGKAVMVAWFFMHLKEERGWLKFIAAIPISAGLYAAVVIAESMFR